jgi:hypothetical protein
MHTLRTELEIGITLEDLNIRTVHCENVPIEHKVGPVEGSLDWGEFSGSISSTNQNGLIVGVAVLRTAFVRELIKREHFLINDQ